MSAFNILLPWGGYNGVCGYKVTKCGYSYGYLLEIQVAGIEKPIVIASTRLAEASALNVLLGKFQEFQLRASPAPTDVLDLRSENFKFS